MDLDIRRLQIDDANADEAARHGVTDDEIIQVWRNEPVFVRNRSGRRAPYLMIGRTFGGRLLTVPLAETTRRDTFRPATAFESSPGEVARYRQAGGQ